MCALISNWGSILNDSSQPLKARFRALFALKNVGGPEAVKAICDCFCDDSALLKHELAYCLGQMQAEEAADFLINILKDVNEDTMVRHEAGEALGAMGLLSLLPTLQTFVNDDTPEVAQTCQLAVGRIKWLNDDSAKCASRTSGGFESIDPAPPSDVTAVNELEANLLNPEASMWDRYRAMFALRNMKSDEAVKVLAKGLSCEDSALFRHEIAYVLGQLQSSICQDQLLSRLQLARENYMVRHECAEALGSIGGDSVRALLEPFANDAQRVVRESVMVALDMAEYENSDQLQFSDAL